VYDIKGSSGWVNLGVPTPPSLRSLALASGGFTWAFGVFGHQGVANALQWQGKQQLARQALKDGAS
jgi:hypothetical protein